MNCHSNKSEHKSVPIYLDLTAFTGRYLPTAPAIQQHRQNNHQPSNQALEWL